MTSHIFHLRPRRLVNGTFVAKVTQALASGGCAGTRMLSRGPNVWTTEIGATAGSAVAAIASVPADAGPLANRQTGDAWAYGIDDAHHLVARDARVLNSGE